MTNTVLTWLGVKGDARDPTGDPMLLKPVGDFWLVSLLGWESLSSSSASDDAETWCWLEAVKLLLLLGWCKACTRMHFFFRLEDQGKEFVNRVLKGFLPSFPLSSSLVNWVSKIMKISGILIEFSILLKVIMQFVAGLDMDF